MGFFTQPPEKVAIALVGYARVGFEGDLLDRLGRPKLHLCQITDELKRKWHCLEYTFSGGWVKNPKEIFRTTMRAHAAYQS